MDWPRIGRSEFVVVHTRGLVSESTQFDPASDPLRVMRSRWLLCLVLAVVGLCAGIAASSLHETETTAEARLAVGSQSLDAYRVAGYAVASEALAANYARFVQDSSSSTDVLEDVLGESVFALTSVTASPIPDSNVIRVEVTGTSPEAVTAAAGAVADNLVAQAIADEAPSANNLLVAHQQLAAKVAAQQEDVNELKARVGTATAPGDVADARRLLTQASARLASLQLRTSVAGLKYQQLETRPAGVETDLRVIQPAAITGDDRRRTIELYGGTGLLLGLALGLIVANLLGPKRQRRRSGRVAGRGETPAPGDRPAGDRAKDRTSARTASRVGGS